MPLATSLGAGERMPGPTRRSGFRSLVPAVAPHPLGEAPAPGGVPALRALREASHRIEHGIHVALLDPWMPLGTDKPLDLRGRYSTGCPAIIMTTFTSEPITRMGCALRPVFCCAVGLCCLLCYPTSRTSRMPSTLLVFVGRIAVLSAVSSRCAIRPRFACAVGVRRYHLPEQLQRLLNRHVAGPLGVG